MIPPYTLIIPYYKTPEITRLALKSIQACCRGTREIIVIDNAPRSPESGMLKEFPEIRWIGNETQTTGSAANFEAVDIGLKLATHDFVGILHSDTIFLKEGWDTEIFGRMVEKNLAALGTFEREASPHRPLHRKLGDAWRHIRHQPKPPKGSQGKLMMYFLLTRVSVLKQIPFSFSQFGHVLPLQLENILGGIEVLSCVEISRFMWHTNNVTSLLTGQMTGERTRKTFETKRKLLLNDPRIRRLL